MTGVRSESEIVDDDASFEVVVARLSEVVEELEQGDLALERSLAIFERGIHLHRLGARRLDEAERRVEALLNRSGAVETRPIEDLVDG